MIVASIGMGLSKDMGLVTCLADEDPVPVTFGPREALVAKMQETPAEELQPHLVELLKQGTSLHDLVAAAALANAREFAGEDYIGFHTLMALGPAFSMAELLPTAQQALPVLKVLYRNSSRIQDLGGRQGELLHAVRPTTLSSDLPPEEQLRQAVHARDRGKAEGILAAILTKSPEEAYNALLLDVEEATEVHRVVLAHRSWDMLGLVGREHAQTMLRQSLRYCVKQEENTLKWSAGIRKLLPKLLDQYRLASFAPGNKTADDAWVKDFSEMLFNASPEQAAEAVAAALAEGMHPEHVGEALTVAANLLLLRDNGRYGPQIQANKPAGSVHGDSVGLHASDTIHAWRGIARTANPRNAAAALILAGYQIARDKSSSTANFKEWRERPLEDQLARIKGQDEASLLKELDGTIREKNQEMACAIVHRLESLGVSEKPVFNLLLQYAISEDGALHAEKYFRTTREEFAGLRPAFRWREVVGLARVSASAYGYAAPGLSEARKLLGIA